MELFLKLAGPEMCVWTGLCWWIHTDAHDKVTYVNSVNPRLVLDEVQTSAR